MHALDKVRLRDPDTGRLLHMSGHGTTDSARYAWLGFLHQAETLKEHAETRGEVWPFQPVPRALIDRPTGPQAIKAAKDLVNGLDP
ncbi:MAG: hypothetical protein AAF092_05260 [Pseudomonadota bacterium]